MDQFKTLFKFALAKEEEAAAFYEFLAASVKQQNIRKVFLEFAENEKTHKKVFENLIKGCARRSPRLKASAEDLRLSEHLVDIPFDPNMTYQDSLIVGMKREEKSHALYLDLSRKVDDPELAKKLTELAAEEARHKARLEAIYDKEVLTDD